MFNKTFGLLLATLILTIALLLVAFLTLRSPTEKQTEKPPSTPNEEIITEEPIRMVAPDEAVGP